MTLHGLGFRDETDLDRQLDTFSGGELTRASLGRALAGDPDLLLLDEPTNHLDIASLEWLEQHLVSLDAAIILVAHDRWFLEAVGTSVLELEAGKGRFFDGPWHAWRREKAARELSLGRAIERQQAEIERLERFVTRFRAGTRARQAQSRVKRLEKIERISRDPADGAALEFAFKPPERSGRVVFELEDASISAGDKQLLEDAELWLERGEHVSIVGANGTGKTTLIETLSGRRELEPGQAADRPQRQDRLPVPARRGTGLRRRREPCSRRRSARPGLTPGKARALLGGFLFSGEDAEKPLDGLSGGERRRLSLAILVHSGANVLILDEPTNHLDLESREALEAALQGVSGLAAARPTIARCSTRSARGRSRSRTGRCTATSVAGPSTCGCASSGHPPRPGVRRAAAACGAPGRRSAGKPRPTGKAQPPGAPGRCRRPAAARAADRGRRGGAAGARGRARQTRRRGRLPRRAPARR